MTGSAGCISVENEHSIYIGVLVMMVEIGQITLPIGMIVFGTIGVALEVPMYTKFRGVFFSG